MKKNKLIIGIILIIALGALTFNYTRSEDNVVIDNENFGASVIRPNAGGTGTSTNPTFGQVLMGNAGGTYDVVATSTLGIIGGGGGSGTVTSVDLSVPTGFTIADNPITTAGTLALGLDTGYQMLTDIASSTWDAKWDALTDLTLAENSVYRGNASNNPEATSDLTILSSGNIGIGTTSPATILDVYGSGGAGDASGTHSVGNFNSGLSSANIKVISSTGTSYLGVDGSGGAFIGSLTGSKDLRFFAGATERARLYSTGNFKIDGTLQVDGTDNTTIAGNVGIGTTNPSEKLDVAGKIALNGTQIAYLPTAYTGTLILGDGGGSLDTGADYNTFVGIGAGFSNTTGSYNTANGYQSLYSNTTGIYNTANGMYSLFSNTTGSYNTANGYQSLRYNTTGIYNTGLGYQAGRYIADGDTANETGTYNTFIGSNTKALADGDTNEMVIGYGATGIGSNTVVLGNDSVVTTALKGNIGIGTASPNEKLDVNGNIRLAENGYIDTGENNFDIYIGDTSDTTQYGSLHLKVPLDGSRGFRAYPRDEAGSITTYGQFTYSDSIGATVIGTASDLDSLVIKTSGNVGIGTTGPGAKLDVRGGINAGTNGTEFTIDTSGNTVILGTLTADLTGNADTVTGFTPASGSLTLAGADALTLTTTAATNVTLPTSGTLVNTAVTSLSSLATIGTIGTGVWNGTAIDFSSYTNATGGRSITLNGDAIDADVETYTGKHKIAFETPTATDDFFFGEIAARAQTFTSIYCKTLVGTVDLDISIGGSDINGTDITCTTSGVLDESLGGDTAGATGEELKLLIESVATAPTYLFVQLNYTYDD